MILVYLPSHVIVATFTNKLKMLVVGMMHSRLSPTSKGLHQPVHSYAVFIFGEPLSLLLIFLRCCFFLRLLSQLCSLLTKLPCSFNFAPIWKPTAIVFRWNCPAWFVLSLSVEDFSISHFGNDIIRAQLVTCLCTRLVREDSINLCTYFAYWKSHQWHHQDWRTYPPALRVDWGNWICPC